VATSFELQSHHQAILNRINIGTLSGSAHVWDLKMFTEYIYKFLLRKHFGIPNMYIAT